MATPRSFIIIKGKPKALQIDKINLASNGTYAVKFKNSPKTFHYRRSDVTILEDAVWYDPKHVKVYISGREKYGVTDIRSYSHGNSTNWRITSSDGYEQDFVQGTIDVVISCLSDEIAQNSFEYLKRIAQTNELGKDEENEGILPSLYASFSFLDQNLAVAPYLDPNKYQVKKLIASDLIFPFDCNASQVRAVTAAFQNQISVIQGPPGTGKTQTILNIISNILLQGKTVMVVSNNNSATANVLEKLQKNDLAFFVAPLGKRENKELFIENQPSIPQELASWAIAVNDIKETKIKTAQALSHLRRVFLLQEELAESRQEKKIVDLEWEHFKLDNKINEDTYSVKKSVKSKRLMKLWLQYQARIDGEPISAKNVLAKLIERIKWSWTNFMRKRLLGINSQFDGSNDQQIIQELQALYLLVRREELSNRIDAIEKELSSLDANEMTNTLTSSSMALLKDALHKKYYSKPRLVYAEVKDLTRHASDVIEQYPVVLSTTFSSVTSLPGQIFDYLIMDEASQVSIETGALALACARNAVIVGDTMQLPNVVTDEEKLKLDGIFREFKVNQGFNCAKYSFLQSVCSILPNVEQTLLREHYRCHPTIINFCNQRFYAGNLLIMTQDHGEKDVMMAIKTVPGHHCRNHYNQREIDVVLQEVIPKIDNIEDVGIITPYNNQVDEFNRQIPSLGAATIHKYQGREKDSIIMSVVDDQITEFSDDSNLINVAVSRAKDHFYLVVSGNEQELRGNISELIDYIEYQNLTVTESKISSIFDYLYSNYTAERMAFMAGHRNISKYDSENLTYSLLEIILSEYPEYNHLGILCHTPLRNVIRDWSLLNENEKKYISHYSTHLDFLLINHVTKKPVLAIETDGYSFHNDETEQHRRDLMKNHILETHELPLLRLKTNESGEKEKVVSKLQGIINGIYSKTGFA